MKHRTLEKLTEDRPVLYKFKDLNEYNRETEKDPIDEIDLVPLSYFPTDVLGDQNPFSGETRAAFTFVPADRKPTVLYHEDYHDFAQPNIDYSPSTEDNADRHSLAKTGKLLRIPGYANMELKRAA